MRKFLMAMFRDVAQPLTRRVGTATASALVAMGATADNAQLVGAGAAALVLVAIELAASKSARR